MAEAQVATRPAHLLEPRGPDAGGGEVVKKVVVQAGAYDGQRHDGYRHGQGCYMWSNGQKYDGEWRNDMRNGQGTETWPDGRRYHGEWKNDMFHGKGVWTWTDGNVFQGVFQHYCPLSGELFMPDGTMYHVQYDGATPVYDGTCPVGLVQTLEADEQLVQQRQEEMYEMLCTNRVLSQMLRERWIKGDDVELAQGEHVLRIDEVFLRAQEETRRSVEIRRSLDTMRRVSLEAKRRRGELNQALEGPAQEGAIAAPSARSSVELVEYAPTNRTERVSIEMERRPAGGFEGEREGHWASAQEEETEQVDEEGHVLNVKQRWHKETFSGTSGSMMEEARRISLEVRSRVSLEMKRMSQEVRRQIGKTGDLRRTASDPLEARGLLTLSSKDDLHTIPDSPHAKPIPHQVVA